MKKILVPLDGSDNSKKALQKAKEIALGCKSEVTLVHVINDLKHPYIMEAEFLIETRKVLNRQGEEVLKEGLEEFGEYPEKVNTILRAGDPAQEIIEMAEKEGYDLVVMGSRGLGVLARAMIGSVSHKVLNQIRVSVLIVK